MAFRENIALGKVKAREVNAKSFYLGGDPLNGTQGTQITATGAELNLLDGAVDGVGAKAGALNTATEALGHVQKTTLTLAAQPVTITFEVGDDSGHGALKLYDFPAGRILVLGVVADLSVNVHASANIADTGSGDLALGTTGTADGTLNSTDVDLLPSTAITDPMVAGVGTAKGALAASAQFDGTTTAKDLYLNLAFDAGDVTTADGEALVSGTIVVTWINLGDY